VTKSRKIKWLPHLARKEAIGHVYKLLVRKFEGNGSSAKLRHIIKGKVKMGLRKIWYEGIGWSQLVLHMAASKHGNEYFGSITYHEFY
jgi:hypothetical protein